MAYIILGIGLLVFAGHFLTGLFERTKIPDVLVLMLAGIVLGPVLHIISPEDFGAVGPVFTTLALIIILFEGGIHLSLRALGQAARDTLLISLATFAITVLLTAYVVDLLLPVEPLTALLIGMILGGSSSAVVVPLIRILKLSNLPSIVLFLESALTDVLTVVLSLGLMRAMTLGVSVTPAVIAGDVAKSFLIAAAIGLGGAFIWSAILPKIRQFPNTIFTTIAYVLILFGLTEIWGYSGAIAALTFGIAVTNFSAIPERLIGKLFSFRLVGFAETERTFFGELVFLIKTFFFVFLGLSMTFADSRTVLVGFTVALMAFVGRIIMVRLIAPHSITRREAMHMTALVPKGLAAAVLAALPVRLGLANGALIQGTVYAVVFFSIVMCAVFVFTIESGIADRFAARLFKPFAAASTPEPATDAPARPPLTYGLPRIAATEPQEPNPIQLDQLAPPPRTDPMAPAPEDDSSEPPPDAD